MDAPGSRLRLTALISLGALTVHQGRFLVGYGEHAEATLREQGHAYLSMAGPLVALLLAVAAAHFLALLVPGRPSTSPSSRARGLLRLWLVAAGLLLAVYVGQELVEGMLSPGHPAGIAGVLAHGGWTALALAAGAGALVALLCRGAERALGRAACGRLRLARPTLLVGSPAGEPVFSRLDVLAQHLAGRGPPLAR